MQLIINEEIYLKSNRTIIMYEKKLEKKIYETPVITKQQIILEQVIAAGSYIKSTSEVTEHEWIEESIDNGDVIIF